MWKYCSLIVFSMAELRQKTKMVYSVKLISPGQWFGWRCTRYKIEAIRRFSSVPISGDILVEIPQRRTMTGLLMTDNALVCGPQADAYTCIYGQIAPNQLDDNFPRIHSTKK